MTILYSWLVGLPLVMMFFKIKAKEYDDPMLFVILIGWIIGCSVLWFYMGWFDLESGKEFFDPDFIWKN